MGARPPVELRRKRAKLAPGTDAAGVRTDIGLEPGDRLRALAICSPAKWTTRSSTRSLSKKSPQIRSRSASTTFAMSMTLAKPLSLTRICPAAGVLITIQLAALSPVTVSTPALRTAVVLIKRRVSRVSKVLTVEFRSHQVVRPRRRGRNCPKGIRANV